MVVCVVQKIEATSAIGSGQAIGEFTGSVMTREEYEHDKPFDVYVSLWLLSLLYSTQIVVVPSAEIKYFADQQQFYV